MRDQINSHTNQQTCAHPYPSVVFHPARFHLLNSDSSPLPHDRQQKHTAHRTVFGRVRLETYTPDMEISACARWAPGTADGPQTLWPARTNERAVAMRLTSFSILEATRERANRTGTERERAVVVRGRVSDFLSRGCVLAISTRPYACFPLFSESQLDHTHTSIYRSMDL